MSNTGQQVQPKRARYTEPLKILLFANHILDTNFMRKKYILANLRHDTNTQIFENLNTKAKNIKIVQNVKHSNNNSTIMPKYFETLIAEY